MKNKTNWAIGIKGENMSKVIQSLAFAYGYTWKGVLTPGFFNYTGAKYLIFYPEDKSIKWTNYSEYVVNETSKTVSKVEEAIELFENLPKQWVTIGNWIRFYDDGSVYFETSARSMTSEEVSQLVNEYQKLKGNVESKLPNVSFKYAKNDENGNDYTFREILVTDLNDKYLEGFDVRDSYNFKKFLLKRVVDGRICMTGFGQRP